VSFALGCRCDSIARFLADEVPLHSHLRRLPRGLKVLFLPDCVFVARFEYCEEHAQVIFVATGFRINTTSQIGTRRKGPGEYF